jgi:hypothetical protein
MQSEESTPSPENETGQNTLYWTVLACLTLVLDLSQ